jgi:tetratricopeptide (TPR) repeat protein
MQNLTAHYNILYNAKELINLSEKNIQSNYSDNYERLISVYKEPNESLSQSELKNLDEAILKANTIANEKTLSKYVDNAYFLIGKSNHLRSNFYNAVEFFNYVYLNYPKEKEIRQAALAWKARSLIASERLEEAEITLDTALFNINSEKKSVADIYATRAQLYIYSKEDQEAISLLENAIKTVKNKQKKIRWTYLLAQLYEITDNPQSALVNYTKVIKSNAPFDMAFNANLSRINLKTELNGDTSGRTKEIMALLKDDKNRELIDQIYFQIANSYAQANNLEKAIENYNLAIQKSTKNLNLKGLAYVELAEIYFDQSDFLRAKAYYDSTLISLPKTFPDYSLIKRKADNLELLSNGLTIIAKEDTLQMLAKLPDSERRVRINKMIVDQVKKAQDNLNTTIAGNTIMSASQNSFASRDTRFYFNNSTALSQGMADFKKRWGPRKLEDNWRRSQRVITELLPSAILPEPGNSSNPFQTLTDSKTEPDTETLIKEYLMSVPLSPEQLAESNQKIALALYDIANYYRDISADTAEAVKTYEQLLNRFPENQNKLAVYYNLYRLYNTVNKKQSEEYKTILLSKFPDSPFAKIILDPDFNNKQDEQEAAFNRLYNDIYDLYVKKNYPEMLNSIEKYRQVSGVQKVPAQLAYLNSLAIGHTQKLPELENAFRVVIANFPEDKLIVPLIKQHLAFIDSNRTSMEGRIVALSDQNLNDRFFQELEIKQAEVLVNTPVITNNLDVDTKEKIVSVEPEEESGPFRKEDSADHYFVVNISDPSVNLSSSRFGIGQFNRANLPGSAIKHQLKSVANQNQLIFVGPFAEKEAALTYFTKISPLMRSIMKIPVGKYNTFIINFQNFEKLIDRDTLDQYIEYYKKNY